MNEQTKYQISLIAYFGYGYLGREDDYWYAVTQFLIWQTIAPEGDIFFKNFTTGLREDNRYIGQRNAILQDVENYKKKSGLYNNSIPAMYGDNIAIDLPEKDFEIINSPYDYTFTNKLYIENLQESGTIKYKQKDEAFYQNQVVFYESFFSQDLLLPGNVISPTKEVTIEVYRGNIVLEIEEEKDAYSIEAKFEDVCFGIYDSLYGNDFIDKICTNKDIIYESITLPHGEFFVQQISAGDGYVLDETRYCVQLSHQDEKVIVHIVNKLVKNDISLTKYFCDEKDCHFEEGVEFGIYDKEDNLVTKLVTNNVGNATYKVGYGTYTVKQLTGKEGFEMVSPYKVKVVDEVSNLHKDLYDKIIIKEEPVIPGEPIDKPIEEEPKKDPEIPEKPTETPKEEPEIPEKPVETPKEDPIIPEKPSPEELKKEPVKPEEPKKDTIPSKKPEEEKKPEPIPNEIPSVEEPPNTGVKESFTPYIIYFILVFINAYCLKSRIIRKN